MFFDWFNTLARFEPPREELYRQAFRQSGIELPTKDVIRGILTAGRYYFEENAKSPLAKRSPEEQTEVYTHYPKAILAEAGVQVPQELPLKILKTVMQQFKGMSFALFGDVLSTLKTLKEQNFILGLLTNIDRDINPICRELGMEPYINFAVTSGEVGVDKPKPPIFLTALQRAGVNASEAVHVGDQYQLDIIGARGVGITPILIDRHNLYSEVSDCPRIHSLTELTEYLQ